MIPTGLLDKIAAKQRSKSLDAIDHTDLEEGQLQLSSASTIPLNNPTDSQPGQLQQPNPSTDSPRVRSSEGSISSLAGNKTDSTYAGIRDVAISPAYPTIFYEIARVQSRFPSSDIEIINAEGQEERAEYLQYVAFFLNIEPKGAEFTSSDF